MKQILGWYLIVVSVAVGLQFCLEFTYELSLAMKVWFVLDWFSAIGYAICLWANFRSMTYRNCDVFSSLLFYATIGLALAFVHNFMGNIFGNQDDLQFWKFINVLQVPLFLAVGWSLREVFHPPGIDTLKE